MTDALIHEAKAAEVGGFGVRRAMPRVGLRTVGAWCFVDHMGPEVITETTGLDVGPHPHIGLHTVTWLLDGSVLHTDSLGSEQLIRPGQLNLMTAGHGIVHAEESVRVSSGSTARLHGIQLWIAQPEATRHGSPRFAHHSDLPQVDLRHGVATVLIGEFAANQPGDPTPVSGVSLRHGPSPAPDGTLRYETSPARVDTPLLGVDLDLRPGSTAIPLRSDFEYAVYVAEGELAVDGSAVREGQLLDLRLHRNAITIDVRDHARALLLGGEPLGEPLTMWWNFVGRSREEMKAAASDWATYAGMGAHTVESTERFGRVATTLAPIPAPKA